MNERPDLHVPAAELAEWDAAGFETMLRDSLGDHVRTSCADLGHIDDVIERVSGIVTEFAAAARASERETIRQLAIEHNAQCHHADGSGGDFADLIASERPVTPPEATGGE